jgi:hypothetical protein
MHATVAALFIAPVLVAAIVPWPEPASPRATTAAPAA